MTQDPSPSPSPTGPGDSFSLRILRSGVWAFSLRIVHQIFYFARIIILARILAPRDFGLMGIALLSIAVLGMFSQTGFQSALIQKKESVASYLNTAWTALIGRGLVLFLILYFGAPAVARFFRTPEAVDILRIIGLSLVLQAGANIGVLYFQKELDFRKQFLYQSLGLIVDFTVATAAALLLRSVWALVLGLLAADIAKLVTSYVIHPFRPRFAFDRRKAAELFGFGKWVLGTSILIFIITQGDDIFIGKILGATMLGLYQLAYKLSNTPATEITNVISDVMFPAYAKIQDEPERLEKTFFDVFRMTTFFSFPVAGLILVFAPSFTGIFLGAKWMGMVPAAQVLCLFGLLSSINTTFGTVFFAKGRPEILTKISFIQVVFLAAVIYPLTRWRGIAGTAVAVTLTCSIDTVLCLVWLRKLLGFRAGRIFAEMRPHLLATLLMGSAAYGFQRFAGGSLGAGATFALSLALALSIYAGYGRKTLLAFWNMRGRILKD